MRRKWLCGVENGPENPHKLIEEKKLFLQAITPFFQATEKFLSKPVLVSHRRSLCGHLNIISFGIWRKKYLFSGAASNRISPFVYNGENRLQ